ncbi:MAG TPA: cation-transporting P-type ATPase [Candidatus Limnocylindrales bacterium]|nr:cation-transporting P-type ATPase [Candidatus Limnocylindrales bacterium]
MDAGSEPDVADVEDVAAAPPTPATPAAPTDPWAMAVDAVARQLEVDPRTGLSSAEAAARAEQWGANELEHHKRESVWKMVLEAATEPFVLLLAAAGIGAVLLNEVRDGILVLLGLIPIVGADVVTEYRGERALEALREASAPRARVRRDGALVEVASTALVPGDLAVIRVGDVVPADLRLAVADRLSIDRSILTGESLPEAGQVEPDPIDAELATRHAMAFAGTSVVAGRGEGIVIATGARTEVGRIAGGLATRQRRRSPLQRELDRLVRILLVVAIGLIGITSGLGFLRGNPLGENLLAGISAAIAAIPEEPPILLAVILGLGAYRLLKRGVLVRRLNAEEVLGAVDLVVTDKTGTLTQNRLAVASVMPVGDADRREVVFDALRAEDDAWLAEEGVGRSSFTEALAAAVRADGGDARLPAGELVSTTPFSDGRPYTSTVARRDGIEEALAIGAPEVVVGLCIPAGADPSAEGADDAASWHSALGAAAERGERVVGVVRRRGAGPWSLRGLIGFADPLRPGMAEATRGARDAGIQVVMVTGDHPTTARSIARQAGLDDDHVVLGPDLTRMTDEELAAALPNLRVIARSTPDQKRRIVEVARRAGRLVAVTGDGVNDAPALHAADVAVAMGSGTAVAREASDLVLGDDSFATLVYGMHEGRRIVDNVQKGLVFLVSTHVALLGFLLIATVAGYSQPLLPIQILWLELFIDTSTSVAFEREPAEPDVMRRPPRRIAEPLLTRGLLGRISLAGAFSAFAALALLVTDSKGPGHGQWLAYTALVCAQAVRAYANRSLTQPLGALSRNGVLLGAAIAVVLVQAAMPFVPALADAFRAQSLDLVDWTLVAIVALAPALVAQVIRRQRHVTWVA